MYFLSGLPRSGNTLLSALLNQNPEIYCSPLSTLSTIMYQMQTNLTENATCIRNEENYKRTCESITNYPKIFYKDVNKPIIIDRDKYWGTPGNLFLIKEFITPTPKIIFTVRDILEILASFVKLDFENILTKAKNANLYMSEYRSSLDLVCEYLMLPNASIDKSLLSLSSAFKPENKGMFHIVDYNDLVNNPEETMKNIYTFLEIDHFKHDFLNIKKQEVDNDLALGYSENTHNVFPVLKNPLISKDILSNYIKQKYSNLEFWKNSSLLSLR